MGLQKSEARRDTALNPHTPLLSQAAKAKPSKESEVTPYHRYTDVQGRHCTWDNHDLHMKAQTVVLVCAENEAWV